MRFPFVLPALCAVSAMAAASPWDDFLHKRQLQETKSNRWILCIRSGDASAAELLNDPLYQRLVTGGDLAFETLGAAEAKDLWHLKAWGNSPHWVLLSPGGDLAATGPGKPTGTNLLNAIHAAGGQTRWELRDAFLKDHPDQGEARLEAATQAFRLARTRLMALDRSGKVQVPAWHSDDNSFNGNRISLPPGMKGEALVEDLANEWAEAVEQLVRVPGWAEEARVLTSQLSFWDVSSSSRMRRLFALAAGPAEDRLREFPNNYERASFWVEAMEAAGQTPRTLAGLCLPLPGHTWPSPTILSRLLEPFRRRRDWDGMLKAIGELTPHAPPEPLSAGGWDDYCRLQAALQANKAMAQASQGNWDLAGATLADARQWGGGGAVREALLMRGPQGLRGGADLGAWRNLLTQTLGNDGRRLAMPELPGPMRLVVLGSPKWILAWSALSRAPELAPWAPTELRWEAASREAHAQLQQTYAWGPEPRWALFRGDELRATGTTCPDPRGLAATLEGEAPAMLQLLQAVVDQQPSHLAARRERFQLLQRRMPDPRLEPALAQEAAEARVTLEFDPNAAWKPDPDLWAAAAQKVLPQLEEELRSWPTRMSLWQAWISWAPFHPAHPSIVTLAQSLPYWNPAGDWRVGLPYPVQRAVAAEMRRQGSFSAMREWFRAAWDALDHRPLASLRRGEREWMLEQRREEETAIFQPLRDALRALSCTAEQGELERQFGEMMGREGGRRQ